MRDERIRSLARLLVTYSLGTKPGDLTAITADASASSNENFLHSMISQDRGAKIMGEIALGTNYDIEGYTKNTLFDEKIGGTFHMALGSGFPETGNNNRSGLHWDMVCDLRRGGTVEADGKLVQSHGLFTRGDWPR